MSGKHYAPALAGAPKSIKLVKHKLDGIDETNEEYAASAFGGFTDYNRRKKVKLQNQDALIRARAPADLPAVFAGMTIHINGYTKPGRVELWNMIVLYGGVYKQYLEGKTDVTHIVASNLTKKKQEEFARYRIVRPEWIVDSISAGKALPWTDVRYRVIDAGNFQKTLHLSDTGDFALGTNDLSRSYKRVSDSGAAIVHEEEEEGEGDQIRANLPPDGADEESPGRSVPEHQSNDVGDSKRALLDKATSARAAEPSNVAVTESDHVQQNPITRSVTKTAKDPDFIQDYFRNSRLHHLSTWKANLRLKIDNLSKAARPAHQLQTESAVVEQKYVMHIDFDCFFAAISSMKRTDLDGKPCAVTHGGSNSGEIASCNYKAREFGVKNGMWMKEAVKMCPDIISLPYEFESYERASELFYESLLELRPSALEAVSIDEALVNITNLLPTTEDTNVFSVAVDKFSSELRALIRLKTGVEVSLGIGANVLQAKLATKKAKPAGHFYLDPDKVLTFLDKLEVSSLPGVGHSTATRLEEHFGVTTIEQLRTIAQTRLQDALGPKTGTSLSQASHGIDETIVGEIAQRKLVSIEINWGIRLDTAAEVSDYMNRVSQELCRKLKDVGFVSAQHLLVKVMRRAKTAPVDPPKFLGHGLCDKFNAGRGIPTTGEANVVWRHALALLEGLNIPPHELRGIGVALTKLQPIGSALGSEQRPMSNYFQSAALQEHEMGERLSTESPRRTSMGPPRSAMKKVVRIDSTKDLLAESNLLAATQFVVPSQIDATVLAELPRTIRERIEAGRRSTVVAEMKNTASIYDVPSVSQIDPADLAALPASVRHEIHLNSHNRSNVSPKKDRNSNLNDFVVKTPSPKKKKVARIAETLTQGNFVSRPTRRDLTSTFRTVAQATAISSSPSADIDREVLAGLPDDIRREILSEDRNRRLIMRRREGRQAVLAEADKVQAVHAVEKLRRTIALPVPPHDSRFGDLGTESLQSLQQYLITWFQNECDEGPAKEDVVDFEGYLCVLVSEERDIEKVEALLRWFWLVVNREHHSFAWKQTVGDLVDRINDTMVAHGFGELRIL